jgi:uroporphyrinogen-III synthase
MTDLPPEPGTTGLAGLCVCLFESRKEAEMRTLVERQGGTVLSAPSMREISIGDNPDALAFAERLLAGEIDAVVFLTGVGARALLEAVEPRIGRDAFLSALQQTCTIVRGPKPAAVLREWKVKIDYQVAEPNTWHDLLALLDAHVPIARKAIAVQEYGEPNHELYAELERRGAEVVRVPVYRWALPEDLGPLQHALAETIAGRVDVLMLTSAQQLRHILEVAAAQGLREAWLAAARRCVVASIGPTASATIAEAGLPVDIQPEHPKMGHLVLAAGRVARALLKTKRSATENS